MQINEIIEKAIILIHLFFRGVEKGCTENKWVKLSLGCHHCKMNKKVNFLSSNPTYKISRNFPNLSSILHPHCVSSTVEKSIFFQLKFQSLRLSGVIYYNHSRVYSHLILVQVTVSCILRFSAHFHGFYTYNRGQNF